MLYMLNFIFNLHYLIWFYYIYYILCIKFYTLYIVNIILHIECSILNIMY
jgi:hypothetical protein